MPLDAAGWPPTVLPYGVVRHRGGRVAPATALGHDVVDLPGLAAEGLLDGALPDPVGTFATPSLDRLLASGPRAWWGLRRRLLELARSPDRLTMHRAPLQAVTPRLAWHVADYVDFFSSREHATNVGHIFRPEDPALPPAWDHVPIGYHGRSGTVVVSGTDVVRPRGLHRVADGRVVEGPEPHLDVEVELGWVVGVGTASGTTVSTTAFADHVLGAVLVNDWSARAIQGFEARPLGPFLGKSFATSVSPWIVPLDALAAARVAPPAAPHPPVGHLAPAGDGYDVALELALRPERGVETVLTRPRAGGLRWTPAQQLAHLTSNGARLRSGDLYASGTVSGSRAEEVGCLLERSWGWRRPVPLDDGEDRRDGLADGDTVTIRGWAPGHGTDPVPLGEVSGRVVPAR